MTDGEFWRLTLAQFDDLSKRYGDDLERQDWRFGLVASVIAEVNRDKKKKSTAFTPADFMPKKANKETPNAEQLQDKINAAMAAFGGK